MANSVDLDDADKKEWQIVYTLIILLRMENSVDLIRLLRIAIIVDDQIAENSK